MTRLSVCLTCILSLIIQTGAFGATLTGSAFSYQGGGVALPEPGNGGPPTEIQAYWDPRSSAENTSVHAPGFHISFFGSARGCPVDTPNGPTAMVSPSIAGEALSLTGISISHASGAVSWTPVPKPGPCNIPANVASGPTFVSLNPAQGIGLFTYTGSGPKFHEPHFWGAFSSMGQDGRGSNAFIADTSISWSFNWRSSNSLMPWGRLNNAEQRVDIRTRQMVVVASSPIPSGAKLTQVKQQYAVTFINPSCLQHAPSKRACQIRYGFHTALIRSHTDWARQQWANKAQLILDPAQSGLPVFIGPLEQDGSVTDAGYGGLDLWRSRGAATQHGPFSARSFDAEISFQEFCNGLRIIAARLMATQPSNIQNKDLDRLFGSEWNDPKAWRIADTNVAQEVHNPSANVEAYIGGSVTELSIRSYQ